jgi:tetratricopeptide (TPR) repeat protein
VTTPNPAQRALALVELGQLDEAERAAGQMLATDPNHQLGLLALVVIRQQQGDVAGLVEASRRLIGAWPEQYLGYAMLSGGLVQLQRSEEGLAPAERAVALAPTEPIAANALAATLAGLPGRADDALRAADRAIELDPGLDAGWSTRSAALLVAGRYPEAIEAVQRAIALNPTMPLFRFQLANAYLRSGRPEDGVAVLRSVLADEPTEQILNLTVMNLLETGVPEPSRELYQRTRAALRQPDVTDPEVRVTDPAAVALRCLYGTGRLAGDGATAGRMADAVLRDVPGQPVARRLAAQVAEDRGELVEAIRLAEGLLDGARPVDGLSADDGFRVHHVRTHSYQRLGRHAEALAALDDAIAAYPDIDEFQRRRAEVLDARDGG